MNTNFYNDVLDTYYSRGKVYLSLYQLVFFYDQFNYDLFLAGFDYVDESKKHYKIFKDIIVPRVLKNEALLIRLGYSNMVDHVYMYK